uniref:Odorant-binding protein 8 n=1 Tax=Anopheles stephensi TaxID=30069 RepID=A0A182YH66_ANOST
MDPIPDDYTRRWAEVTYHVHTRLRFPQQYELRWCSAAMKTLLVSISLFVAAQGAYVVRTFADATRYKDECAKQYSVRGSPLIDYMRQVALHTDDADSRWCIIRCILHKSELLAIEQGDVLHESNVHAQMQYSNAIVEDPDDIRSETSRCLQEPNATHDECLRAYTFFACIQSTEYDLF